MRMLLLLSVFTCNLYGWWTQSSLLESVNRHFYNTVLQISEEKIESIIEEARYHAQRHSLNEKELLGALLIGINGEIAYQEHRRDITYDIPALARSGGCFLLGAAGLGLLYAGYRKWHKPWRDEIAAIYKEYGSSISERVEFTGGGTTTYIRGPQSARLVQLKNKIKNYWEIEFLLGAFAVTPFVESLRSFYQKWKSPFYPEKYEKLLLIKKCLEKALITPRKNITFF